MRSADQSATVPSPPLPVAVRQEFRDFDEFAETILGWGLDYIENHADEPPTVEKICRASGTSWRTLNYAFRDQFGITPKQYLQMIRLQRARRDLLRQGSDASVSETAAAWGFWHMGAFAADYRRQFGELPSETTRQSHG